MITAETLLAAFDRSISIASDFEGATAPNPPVGCVILDRFGTELSSGAHRRAGEPHAEAIAIDHCKAAGTLERAHVLVVTLEPCSHFGRTPPCVDNILSTPIKAVWVGRRDSNPEVLGRGWEKLQQHGVMVASWSDLGTDRSIQRLSARCERLTAPFIKHARTGTPWLTVKQAVDEAGRMIPPLGAKTFTRPTSLVLAHRLRRRADAVLTGSGTVLADDPEFTVRLVPDFVGKQRRLTILDRRRRVGGEYLSAAATRGFVVGVEDTLEGALASLGAQGVLEVLVEAGPRLTLHTLTSELWDEHVLIESGKTADIVSVRFRDQSRFTQGV